MGKRLESIQIIRCMIFSCEPSVRLSAPPDIC